MTLAWAVPFLAGGVAALAWIQRKPRRWARLIRQGGDSVYRGESDRAEASLREALKLAERGRGPFWAGRRMATLLPLAHLLMQRGRYQEASEVAVEYVEAVRRRSVDGDLVVRGLSLLGDISAARGSLEEAEALYRTTLEMEERTLGEHSIELAPTIVKLGSVLASQERRGEADVLFRRCSDIIASKY